MSISDSICKTASCYAVLKEPNCQTTPQEPTSTQRQLYQQELIRRSYRKKLDQFQKEETAERFLTERLQLEEIADFIFFQIKLQFLKERLLDTKTFTEDLDRLKSAGAEEKKIGSTETTALEALNMARKKAQESPRKKRFSEIPRSFCPSSHEMETARSMFFIIRHGHGTSNSVDNLKFDP